MSAPHPARAGLWDWARSVVARHDVQRADAPGELYQTSTMGALLAGVYDGDVTVGELLTHGDFGLGTFNHLDGEMVVLDGVCHHLRADGTAVRADPSQRTPFAAVTRFAAERTLEIGAPATWAEVTARIDALVGSANVMCAVRIDGDFAAIDTRTVREQHRPYPPLVTATAGQAHARFTEVRGTLAGFRMPAYDDGISVSGYHLHFLTTDHTAGGHCLDFRLTAGTVAVATLTELHLSVPRTAAFRDAALSNPDTAEQIRRSEGGH
jgi:acetolactate decarboxylase